MKKLVAILLLGLFALHHVGYFFIYKAFKYQNELTWQSRFMQKNFDPDQLHSTSIPINFPYLTDQDEFQYVDESIVMDGMHYRIVKKRYAQDTLHIVYINDHSGEKIQTDFEKWANQMKQDDSQSNTKQSQNLVRLIDYQYLRSEYTFNPLVIDSENTDYSQFYPGQLKEVFLNIPLPPPKYTA